jgi:hypothetical protein
MSSFYLRAPQDNLHPTRADLEFETTAWLGRRDSNLCIYIRNLPRLSAEGLGLELAHLESKVLELPFLQKTQGVRSTPRSCSGGMKFGRCPIGREPGILRRLAGRRFKVRRARCLRSGPKTMTTATFKRLHGWLGRGRRRDIQLDAFRHYRGAVEVCAAAYREQGCRRH